MNYEPCPFADGAGHVNLAAMLFYQGFDYSKAQSGAAVLARARMIHSIESLENLIQMFGRYTGAGVLDLDHCFAIVARRAYIHLLACWSILNGIFHQVIDHSLQGGPVTFDLHRLHRRGFEFDLP